jgi:hypothetical protein
MHPVVLREFPQQLISKCMLIQGLTRKEIFMLSRVRESLATVSSIARRLAAPVVIATATCQRVFKK